MLGVTLGAMVGAAAVIACSCSAEIDGHRQGARAPVLEVVVLAVLLEYEGARLRVLVGVDDDATDAGKAAVADLHGAFGVLREVPHPVATVTSARQQVDRGLC